MGRRKQKSRNFLLMRMKLVLDTRISCYEGLSFGGSGTANIFFKEKKNATYIHLIVLTQFLICALVGL